MVIHLLTHVVENIRSTNSVAGKATLGVRRMIRTIAVMGAIKTTLWTLAMIELHGVLTTAPEILQVSSCRVTASATDVPPLVV